jgi:CDP-diglyceride synthetase
MEQLWQTISPLWQPLVLLLVANGTPILARALFGPRLAYPLDGGLHFIDGRPLLGHTKSWRGLITSLTVTTLFSILLGLGWWLGALLALLAMAGDACASFIKRRLGIPPHGRASGLDQLPESLLPLWLLHHALALDGLQVVLAALLFMLLDMTLSPLLYRWHVREHPH